MNVHKNARLTRHGRERIVRQVESGQTPEAVAEAAGVCPRTVRKWIDRYRREGLGGLADRSSRPHRLRQPTAAETVETIVRLRRQRWTGKQIAVEAGVSPATVSRVLRRLGLNKLSTLEPEPVRRYEREHPGELIHLDIKKLGRIGSVGHRITGRQAGVVNRHLGIGWEFVHVCIDDASRVAFVQVMADERKASAVAFLEAAVAYYARLGIRVERVMTDNGSCYRSKVFQAACKRLSLRQVFTRPYTPKTNGKAERFIQTSLREWAYARAYNSSQERTTELLHWLHRYNWHRPHGSLGSKPPISRLGLDRDNLLRFHSYPPTQASKPCAPDINYWLVGHPLTSPKSIPNSFSPTAEKGSADVRERRLFDASSYLCCSKEDVAMRTNMDFSPFYRSSIGFDRIFDLLERSTIPQADNWPPYDILKLGEDTYRIALAVAGFAEDELSITHEPNLLVIDGSKTENGEVLYLHHGLAMRTFDRRFELADHVSVIGAKLENGLLIIDLKKEIPEEMKPRRIAISAEADKKSASKRIEGNVAA